MLLRNHIFSLVLSFAIINPLPVISQNPPSEEDIDHVIYLVGNTGISAGKDDFSTLRSMVSQVKDQEGDFSVVFLGNIFPENSLPDGASEIGEYLEGHPYYELMEDLDKWEEDLYFIPGPNEWFYMGRGNQATIRHMENLIQDFYDEKVFFPNKGCPGPEEVEIEKEAVMVFIDTQWWLNHERLETNWKNPDCEIQEPGDMLVQLNDIIKRNQGKHIIIAGYHPLVSYGPHFGYLPAYTHLLPPVFGSAYYLYRNLIGQINDYANPTYKSMVKGLKKILSAHRDVIYVSSHERSLQYIRENKLHQLISGSGKKSSYVKKTPQHFTSDKSGYMKLIYTHQDEMWLQAWAADEYGIDRKIFEKFLYRLEAQEDGTPGEIIPDYTDQTIDTMASTAYGEPRESPGLMGKNYRAEWIQEIQDIPYFDIGEVKGGLKPVKRGGGMQTKSLRLENDDEQEYVLRSVEKYPLEAVPQELRKTLAADIVKDFISSAHPYAAFVIPPLAEAADIYHTNPELYYLPDDPRLGIYREEYGNAIYLFEERPMGKFDEKRSFGEPDDILGTDDVVEEILDDNENYIDQPFVLRSRLFDIWIGDWDRHGDQWRWAEFEDKEDNTYFRPIPRDRDNAFFYNDGLIIKYGTRQPSFAKFQGFDYEIKDVAGMNYNARYFDRTFLTEPDWKEWEVTVGFLQENLTDSVIESAIRKFPEEIYRHSGDEIVAKLKHRRDIMEDYSRKYYEFLSEEVNVLGSDEKEWFEVERISDRLTKVTVWDLKQKSEDPDYKRYERTFENKVTREIRLYGLKDDDLFTVKGRVKKSPLIRIIGGGGDDRVEDFSRVRGLKKKTLIYDKPKGMRIEWGREVRAKLSDDPGINNYNMQEYQYDYNIPLVYIDISPDDGVFLAGEIQFYNYGFRKSPYASYQKYSLRYSPFVNSFKFIYEGDFTEAVGLWDMHLDVNVKYPTYTDYYYGFGNETVLDEQRREEDFYHFNYASMDIQPLLRREFRQGTQYFQVGPVLNLYRLNEPDGEDRLLLTDIPEADIDEFKFYTGVRAGYAFDSRDNVNFPLHGIYWASWVSRTFEVNNADIRFNRYSSDLAFYQSTGGSLNTTFAGRVGGTINDGNYRFYQSADLGGKTNLRGYRRMRFSGDKAAYANLEARIRLFRFNVPLFPASFGVYGFFDAGRVWYENSEGVDPSTVSGKSDVWHAGYGGGVWLAPFRKIVFSADLATSSTDKQLLLNLRYGFFF